ncbi:MAG: hypothetical protein Q9207_003816 [Kuettlingeria erythrocarpa]
MFICYLLLLYYQAVDARLHARTPQINELVPPSAETCMDPITQPQLAVAFDLGATYPYPYQTTSTQTFSQTKPKNATGSCGCWTFLPYYVT